MAETTTGKLVRALALLCICVLAFSVRIFSIVKYESVIHEFDPYFNYRVTKFLTKEGFYNMWNWFDETTWYPLGRDIGGTMYPVSLSAYSCLEISSANADQFPLCLRHAVKRCLLGCCPIASNSSK